jgi:putative transposase
VRRHIAELPSYGYRRAGALLNRERRSQGQAVLNHKRVYRVMARHQLLRKRKAAGVLARLISA